MLTETISKQITVSMKSGDKVRLSTLKLLLSALNYEKIARQHDLLPDEETTVVKREVKKRKDAIEIYDKSSAEGAKERAQAERLELAILMEFMPEQMGEDEISKIVGEVIAEFGAKSLSEMGKVIGEVIKRSQGKADGKLVSESVRKALS